MQCLTYTDITFSLLGSVTFVKGTGIGYGGTSYFTLRNVSLHECQRWCRDETACAGATFNYAPRGDASPPETTCTLHSDENAPSSKPRRSKNTFYLAKVHVDSGKYHTFIFHAIYWAI